MHENTTSGLTAVLPGVRKPTAPESAPLLCRDAVPRSGKPQWKFDYTFAGVGVDVAAALIAIAITFCGRFHGAEPGVDVAASLAFAPAWIALVALSRAYEHRFIGVGTEEFTRVLRAGVGFMALVAFLSYATQLEFARGYVLVAIPVVVVLSLLGRWVLRTWLHRQRSRGLCIQRTLLVGSSQGVEWTLERLRRETNEGVAVVGACLSAGTPNLAGELGVRVFGGFDDIEAAVHATGAEFVTVLSSAQLTGIELRRLAWRLEPSGAELVVCSGLSEIFGSRITVRPMAHSPMLHLSRPRPSGPARLVKGAFDRSAALLGLALISPLLLSVAVAISLSDGANPIFRQKRVGLNGREFTLYKLRTMVPNAERLKAALAEQNEASGVLFKMARDPRITPVGRWLRRYSIDELPQLINVVRGEMSLVGPRPPLAEEVTSYGDHMRRRLLVKPGLTGLWQVSGRSDLSWRESEMLDLRYVENWSLNFDLLILWRTVRAVAGGRGAY